MAITTVIKNWFIYLVLSAGFFWLAATQYTRGLTAYDGGDLSTARIYFALALLYGVGIVSLFLLYAIASTVEDIVYES